MRITGHSIFTVAWWVGMLALAVLVVTGIWLSFAYQPSPAEVWDDLGLGGTSPSAPLTWLHVAAAWVVAGAAVVAAIAGLLDRGRRGSPRVAIALTLPAIWIAVQLGRMLAWDQIALWAVTAGSNLSGVNVDEILGDEFRFFLIDGREIDPDQYLGVFVAHLVVAAVVVAGWVVIGAISTRTLANGPQRQVGSVELRR